MSEASHHKPIRYDGNCNLANVVHIRSPYGTAQSYRYEDSLSSGTVVNDGLLEKKPWDGVRHEKDQIRDCE